MISQNKKAISPLIATVLLVGFSIVLAGIVSTFVINKTKEFKPETIVEDDLLCDSVAIDISVPSTLTYETVSDTTIQTLNGLQLVNKGSFTIKKLTINSEGFPTSETQLQPPLVPQTTMPLTLAVKNDITDPQNHKYPIKIVPWINHPEQNTLVKCQRSEIQIVPKTICTEINNNDCTSS